MIEDAGYTGLAKYFDPKMYENICKSRPCQYYNIALAKELERRENIIPKPTIVHNCVGNGMILFNPLKIRGKYGPYKFKWSSGQDKMSLTNLKPGLYTVTIKDAIGGQIVREYEVKNIRHPYAIEVVKSEFDPYTKKYNIDIQLSCPRDYRNVLCLNVARAGLTHDPQNAYERISFEPRTLHFTNVPPGENELFIDISGSTDSIDLSNECEIIRLGFYLEELE